MLLAYCMDKTRSGISAAIDWSLHRISRTNKIHHTQNHSHSSVEFLCYVCSFPFVWLRIQKYISSLLPSVFENIVILSHRSNHVKYTLVLLLAICMFGIRHSDWYCILIQNSSKQNSNKCDVVSSVMFICHHQRLNRLTCVLFNFFSSLFCFPLSLVCVCVFCVTI